MLGIRAIGRTTLAEHCMLSADYLIWGIAECIKEVVIRRKYLSLKVELHNGLNALYCSHFPREIRITMGRSRHVRCVLDYLHGVAVRTEYGVVTSVDPHLGAVLAQAFELPCMHAAL